MASFRLDRDNDGRHVKAEMTHLHSRKAAKFRKTAPVTRCLWAAGIVLLTLTSRAFGWGNEGHQAIAEAVQGALTDRVAKALAQILVGSDALPPGTLASIATWPDEVRARHAFGKIAVGWDDAAKQEADRFNRDHPTNAQWHFVNLPLGATRYPADLASLPAADSMGAFTSRDDIVQALQTCITILESATPTPTFSKVQAVRWLVHLVGDIHQPLHVTTGYYDTTADGFSSTPTRVDDAPNENAREG
jgi:hypothetical protein